MSFANWVSSWWSVGSFTGPARNAPNNGIDIKKLFDQRPKQVILLSADEVKQELKKLRPTKINAIPPISNRPPIMQEFDNVFNQGYKQFFEARKQRIIEAKASKTVIVAIISTSLDEDETRSENQDIKTNENQDIKTNENKDIKTNENQDLETKENQDIETKENQDVETKENQDLEWENQDVEWKEEILAELEDFQNI